MHSLISIFKHLVNLIFPQTCIRCGVAGVPLCKDCITKLPQAREAEHSFITAIFDYRDPSVRQAIWQFKYRNARKVAESFGEKLYEELLGDLGDSLHISKNESFLLIPIPLHKKRLQERGYNQSELLAREILKYDTEGIFELTSHALIRTRATNAQAKKEKRAARLENLRGAFSANPELVCKKNIILIDDVTTTGATLAEARKVLLKAGARSVRALTVAH
ncbi:MAG: ComF family protein [Candidatus Pacebacteria bacterium]|jgi:ComF family protein|nr:ComF family protein [Candidatus Paceibacterota bacterium]